MKLRMLCSAGGLVLLLAGSPSLARESEGERGGDDGGPSAELTWMSIANWYFNVNGVRIVMDGYITPRCPGRRSSSRRAGLPGRRLCAHRVPVAASTSPASRGSRKRCPIMARSTILIAGHSHFDHTWDTPTWAKLTGAPLIGGLSTCYQAQTQGVSDCKAW